jgi:hypothetical protein
MILEAFFDEMEKIALVGAASAVLAKSIQHPLAAYAGVRRIKKGKSKHEQTMEALRRGYPAGWVSMGMRPR